MAISAAVSEKNVTFAAFPPVVTVTSTTGMPAAFSKASVRAKAPIFSQPGYGILKITTCKKEFKN
jgi:hypothetical protein